jgi:hypothetical protein
MEQEMPVNDGPQPTKAMRLIFEYEGDEVRLVSQQPVEMVITDADLSAVSNPGYYVETKDSGGKALFRTKAHNAFSTSTEVFPEEKGKPITRVDLPKAKGAFTVITPLTTNTDHVSVMQIMPGRPGEKVTITNATSPREGAEEIREIASFKITANQ